MDRPLLLACCTAFHLSLWRKVGFLGEAVKGGEKLGQWGVDVQQKSPR